MDMTEDFLDELQNEADKEHINNILPKVESWVTIDNKNFFFSFKCIDTIPSGLYSMTYNDQQGFGVTNMEYKSEEFFHLPSLPHDKIIGDLQKFWDNKDKFTKYNLNPKRGIILHGHPGCGKTSLIYLLIEEIKKRNGLSIYFDVPENWVEIARLIRKVEKERPLLCIIEDIDLVIAKHGEEPFLNFLDGLNSINNVVYVATTNNIEKIPDRIKDRPSRFDKKYEIKKPNDSDRLLYFQTKLLEEDKKKYDLKKLVKDTTNFTMAHIKEVFISLYILDNPYEEVISRLKKSKITDNPIGFNLNEDYDA
jgi:AAA+ superfamily predicted ATPase